MQDKIQTNQLINTHRLGRMQMKINTQKLYDNYKDIEKECIEKGEIIPYLINPIFIPKEYKLTLEEMYNIKEDKITHRKNYIKHRKIENEIIQKKNKKYATLTDYWIGQLKTFLKNHPHFEEKLLAE